MTALAARVPAGHYRFRHAARMEWIKLRSLRSTWWTLVITVAGAIGIGVTVGINTRDAGGDLTNNALAGIVPALLLSGVLGVLTMTSEYSSGLIRATLTAIPRRGLLLAAKAAVFGAVALAAGEAASFISFFAGGAALRHGITAPALGQPGVLRAVLLAGTGFCLVGLLGLGLGVIIRHSGAAIAVLVGSVYVVPPLIGAVAHQVAAYTPIFIIANSLSTTKPEACGPGRRRARTSCRPGPASACWPCTRPPLSGSAGGCSPAATPERRIDRMGSTGPVTPAAGEPPGRGPGGSPAGPGAPSAAAALTAVAVAAARAPVTARARRELLFCLVAAVLELAVLAVPFALLGLLLAVQLLTRGTRSASQASAVVGSPGRRGPVPRCPARDRAAGDLPGAPVRPRPRDGPSLSGRAAAGPAGRGACAGPPRPRRAAPARGHAARRALAGGPWPTRW